MDFANLTRLHAAHVEEVSRGTARALEADGLDALAVHSGSPVLRTSFDDQFWPLRPTPHFQHWLPLREPGGVLLVEPGRKPKLLRLSAKSFWEAPAPPETDHFWGAFDVVGVVSEAALKEHLPAGRRVAFVGDDLRAAATLAIPSELQNPPRLLGALDQLRVRKTPYEVACLAEANRRAAAGHDALRAAFSAADKSELELHLAFLAATAQDDAEAPYKNIVALGAHAATLHHVSYEKRARPAQSLLLDAGATFAGYCSDITRTWVKGGGAAASAFAALVQGVEALQQRLCAAVRTGLLYEELHDESHREVALVLRDVGISRLSASKLVETGVTRAFYPHGLGHSLGLQAHDVGCAVVKPKPQNPFLRNTTVIAERHCFTIEPGIYFIADLLAPLRQSEQATGIDWKLVDALARLGGVRIEDDVVVEPTGLRNLTREHLPIGAGKVSAPPPSAS